MQRRENQPRKRTRADYARGLPDYHDPTAGIGGAAPAYSALTLRAVLAAFGLLASIAGIVVFLAVIPMTWLAVLFGILAAVVAVDLAWVLHRKARGEPG
jgi:hypothetical protein